MAARRMIAPTSTPADVGDMAEREIVSQESAGEPVRQALPGRAVADVQPPSERTAPEPGDAPPATTPVVTTVTVTWAREAISPVQYQVCEIGPYSMTVDVASGQSVLDAMTAAYAKLSEFAEGVRKSKLRSFREELQAQAVGKSR
jgi:hypothetical protein